VPDCASSARRQQVEVGGDRVAVAVERSGGAFAPGVTDGADADDGDAGEEADSESESDTEGTLAEFGASGGEEATTADDSDDEQSPEERAAEAEDDDGQAGLSDFM
jgi:hypothetical protein